MSILEGMMDRENIIRFWPREFVNFEAWATTKKSDEG
jgi:hypothetical protein